MRGNLKAVKADDGGTSKLCCRQGDWDTSSGGQTDTPLSRKVAVGRKGCLLEGPIVELFFIGVFKIKASFPTISLS